MPESLRSIQVFVAAYEERSFTAAAKREHATQSGVSQHVRKLEERLGAKLFSRDRGCVVPTPAGEAYYERSVELLRLASAADSAVSRFRGSLTGEIVAGLMPTMTRSALAPALSRFTDEQPNVVIRVVEAYSACSPSRSGPARSTSRWCRPFRTRRGSGAAISCERSSCSSPDANRASATSPRCD
jgi:LysR family transcriptional regulator, nitrogen assimilation regulatory protein